MEVAIRRIAPSSLVRICNGWKVGISTIVTLSGIFGFILTLIAPEKLSVRTIILIVLAALLPGVIAAFLRGKQKLLPNTFIGELSSENAYSAGLCTRENLREADEMTKPYFGKGFIPFERIEQWRLKNEKGFVQIVNSQGLLCACFVILGLERGFFDQFIAGKVTEHEIDSDVVLPFDRVKKEDRIYISGVVVRDPGGFIGSKRARVMLWTILKYIKDELGLRKRRTFYAVGLTKESAKLLVTMGFEMCGLKESRKDDSNLYRINLDKETWQGLLVKVGDFSRMVSFEVNP